MWRALSHTTPHFQKCSAPPLFQASQNHPRFRSLSQLSHNLHEQSDCADHKIPPTSCGAWKSKNEGCKGSAITVTKTALFSSALNLCSFSACASRAVSVQGHRVCTITESKKPQGQHSSYYSTFSFAHLQNPCSSEHALCSHSLRTC